MNRFIAIVVMAGLVVGCSAVRPDHPAPKAAALRVMTFNIRYGTANDGDDHWKHRREMVFQVLRDHEPGVLGLQEALRFQINLL